MLEGMREGAMVMCVCVCVDNKMVVDYKVPAVVMLCDLKEDNVSQCNTPRLFHSALSSIRHYASTGLSKNVEHQCMESSTLK